MDNRIKCGKCNSEYNPRVHSSLEGQTIGMVGPVPMDFSCPVCGHGKFNEANIVTTTKTILKD